MSAGSLVGMVMNFIIFAVLSSVLGFAMDIIVTVTNSTNGMSMDALNTMSNLHLLYIAGPLLYLLALAINHIVTSNSEVTGEV